MCDAKAGLRSDGRRSGHKWQRCLGGQLDLPPDRDLNLTLSARRTAQKLVLTRPRRDPVFPSRQVVYGNPLATQQQWPHGDLEAPVAFAGLHDMNG
jgi:hypothetical protein